MSMFDQFLEVETEEASSTVALVLPAGEYQAMIKEIKTRQVTTDKGTFSFLEPTFSIDGGQQCPDGRTVSEVLSRPETTVRGSIILDLNEAGMLDAGPGRNVQLGRLRAAVNQNTPGQRWKPLNLVGQSLRVSVTQRANPKDPEQMFAEVKSFSKL